MEQILKQLEKGVINHHEAKILIEDLYKNHVVLDNIIAMLPTDKDIEKYANGNFGYDRYSSEKEQAFVSGADWLKDELTYKLKNS